MALTTNQTTGRSLCILRNQNSSGSLLVLDPGIRQHFKTLSVLSLPSAQMEEERERESE